MSRLPLSGVNRLRKRIERLEAHSTVEFDGSKEVGASLNRAMSRLQSDERSSVEVAMATRRIDHGSELWCRFECYFSEELKASGFEAEFSVIDLLL